MHITLLKSEGGGGGDVCEGFLRDLFRKDKNCKLRNQKVWVYI